VKYDQPLTDTCNGVVLVHAQGQRCRFTNIDTVIS